MSNATGSRLGRTKSKLLIGLLLSALAALVMSIWSAPGASADTAYPPPPTDCHLKMGIVAVNGQYALSPGQTFTVSGDGFNPGASVEIDLYSTPVQVGSTTTTASGTFNTTVTIPQNIATGSHQLEFSSDGDVCAQGNLYYGSTSSSGGISATGDPTSGSGGLAFTGFATLTAATVGGLVLLSGLLFLLLGRRRRA
jgi:hypothetical protein